MTAPKGIITGGPITGFAGGWAVLFMPSFPTRAHYWRSASIIQEVGADWRAGCGIFGYSDEKRWRAGCGIFGYSDEKRPPLAPGSYPLCKRCEASVRRAGA